MAVEATNVPVQRRRPAAPQREDGRARAFFREAGDLAVFGAQSIRALAGVPRNIAETLRQTSILVRGSTAIIFVLTFLIGYSVILFGYYFLKAVSATDYTGLVSGIIAPRGTAPLMFGYIFAAKVGCGMVAELGAMKVNQETDALESEGVDPLRYVVATRLGAALLFVPLAAIVALVGNTCGDYFAAIIVLNGLSASAFNHYHWGVQTIPDELASIGYMAFIAVVIVIVSCFYGLRARGGPASVGAASARALMVNLVLIHIFHPVYVGLFYGTDVKLPIGG